MEAYLDNSATTRVDAQVQELMKKLMDVDFGNPSSRHQKGVVAEGYIKEARQKIAATLKVDPKELIITSGGTESNNMALIGTALAAKRKGNHIITTAVEHPSVKATASFLEEQGFRITFLSVDSRGQISLEDLKEALTPDTILVSIMYVNNEIGTIQPIEEAAKLVVPHTSRATNREYQEKLVGMVCGKAVRDMFFPAPLRIDESDLLNALEQPRTARQPQLL